MQRERFVIGGEGTTFLLRPAPSEEIRDLASHRAPRRHGIRSDDQHNVEESWFMDGAVPLLQVRSYGMLRRSLER